MIDLIKRYLDNRIQLIKLELVNTLANVTAGLISSFLILVMALFILMMFSFSFAYWLSSYFESNTIGFAIVGSIYILAFVIYFVFSKEAIDKKVKDQIVKASFEAIDDLSDAEDEEDDYVI